MGKSLLIPMSERMSFFLKHSFRGQLPLSVSAEAGKDEAIEIWKEFKPGEKLDLKKLEAEVTKIPSNVKYVHTAIRLNESSELSLFKGGHWFFVMKGSRITWWRKGDPQVVGQLAYRESEKSNGSVLMGIRLANRS